MLRGMEPPTSLSEAARASFNESLALMRAGKAFDAFAPLLACLKLAPEFGPGYVNLAALLRQFGMLDRALPVAEAAMSLLGASVPSRLCMAAVRHERAEYDLAIAQYRGVLALEPDHAEAKSSLASCLQSAGRLAEAMPLHQRAVAALPNDPDAHYNYAEALLASGAFAAGWDEYEWRLRRGHAKWRDFGPVWRGEDLAGRTILLHPEQGFGDTLQFARYAPMVAARGGRVVMEVQPPLVRLMHSLRGVAQVVALGDPLPPFEAHCPLLSLPRAFATRLHSIPAAIPYLQADPAHGGGWAARLPTSGLRVGLVWAGGLHPHANGVTVFDQRRSLPLAAFAPLAGIAGVHLVSLQAGPAAEQLQTPPAGMAVLDPMGDMADFADTAALVMALDLVITVDTAVAHLAGALGRPVWMLSRSDGCWRWLEGRDDSPWYPSLRLYRQTVPFEWDPVIDRVREDLAALAMKAICQAA